MIRSLKPRTRRIAKIALTVFVCLLVAHLGLRLSPFPELARFQNRPVGFAVQDRNGVLLRVLPADDGVRREWVPLKDIPPGIVRVFRLAEDKRFYLHPGVDPVAVAAAAGRNLRAGRTASGASTITMQLARMVSPRKPGMRGKVREAFDALRLEARLSKNEIFELWINNIPFGSNIEGLPAASRARFGMEPGHLGDARALLLAVIPRRPARFDPAREPEASVKAALELSRRAGFAMDVSVLMEAAAEARPEELTELKHPFLAPHFTERIAQLLSDERIVGPVRTTLDLELQLLAERRLACELATLVDNRVTNGAIFVIDNFSGEVLAYVGSASWFDDSINGRIDGIKVRNQPGSTLKPFLFAQALENGFAPNDILPDIPTVFGSGQAYSPANFNRRFNGPVRFRVALASSLNIPAVYLLERIGVDAFEGYLAGLGFNSVAESTTDHGLGLALGNAQVTLEELTRAFAVFPRGGQVPNLVFTRPAGAGVTQPGDRMVQGSPAMSPYAAWLITDILSDRPSRFPGFGPATTMTTQFPSIFKTGTANQFQHIWALGANPRHTVGIWMGNFSGETVIGRTGSSIPARIASDLLSALEAREPPGLAHAFPPMPASEQLLEARICPLSGMAATSACPGTVTEWLSPQTRLDPCTWHRHGDPNPATEFPPEYGSWLAERFRQGTVARPASGRSRIRLPVSGSVFHFNRALPPEAQAIRLEVSGFAPGSLVFADGVLQGSLNHSGVFALPLRRGLQRIEVEDESDYDVVEITVY